jgi:hypothetical protein
MYPELPGAVPLSVCLNVHLTETLDIKRIYPDRKQTPWSESASELYRPSDRRLSAKLVLTFEGRGCHVVSVTDPVAVFSSFYTGDLSTLQSFPIFHTLLAPTSIFSFRFNICCCIANRLSIRKKSEIIYSFILVHNHEIERTCSETSNLKISQNA